MHAKTRWVATLAALAAGALAMVLVLAAQAAGSSRHAARATASCVQRGHARAFESFGLALRTYDDNIEDSGNAPDFCAEELVTNDNGTFTMGIHAHNRSGFVAGDSYGVYFDTDLNPVTGGGGVGAEYEITFTGPRAQLLRWNGTIFDPATASPVPLAWLPEYGPAMVFKRAAIGNPTGFNFVLISGNGVDSDRAPDSGSWQYTVRPFTLKLTSFSVGPARAGKAVTARAVVLRSDFGVRLDKGAIRCAAKLSAHALAGKGKFAGGRVVCTWRLPKTARGRRLSGSVSVTFQGATAKRGFSERVR
jgi:hypothetical protein